MYRVVNGAVLGGKFSFSRWLTSFIVTYLAVLSTGLLTYFSFKIHLPPIHPDPVVASLQQGFYSFIFISPVVFGYLFVLLWFIRPRAIIRAVVASGVLSVLYIIFASNALLYFVNWAIRFFPDAYLWYQHGENHEITIGLIFLTIWLLAIPYILGTTVTATLSLSPLRRWLKWRGLLLALLIGSTLILAAPFIFTAGKFRWSTDPWFMTKITLSFLVGPILPSVCASGLAYLSSQMVG